MPRHAPHRRVLAIPVMFGVVLIGFLLMQVVPTDPATVRAGPIWTEDGALSLILPAVTLGGVFIGPVARMTRTGVLDVLSADHVRTARAKGLLPRLLRDPSAALHKGVDMHLTRWG